MPFNLILDDEDFYGFLTDIKAMFLDNLKDESIDECTKDSIKEALLEIERLIEHDEGSIYHCWYNPMGAFIFNKMVEEK